MKEPGSISNLIKETCLNQFTLGIVTPPMITTSYDCGTPLVFSYYRKAPVPTNVIEAADDAIFRQD